MISTGGDHSCALDDDGVHCWGDDRFGQTNVPSLHHPAQLDAGEHHTCAFDDDGVHCWGSNSVGQTTVPPELELLGRHACAVVGGQVRCVGHNELGQLGVGHDEDVSVAVVKTRPSDLGNAFEPVEEVELGRSFSCALNTRGAVKCWGRNVSGQLGLGDTHNRGAAVDDMGDRLPALVFGESRAPMAKLGLGEDHACALSKANELYCWGKGSSGALGTEATQDVGTTGGAAKVHLRQDLVVSELALGEAHTCLLSVDGTVYCFGRNDVGQLGLGHANNVGDAPGSLGEAMQPVQLGAGFSVQTIASGRHHVCALSRAGAVKCWGANDVGELGLGDTRARGTSASDMGDALRPVDFGHGQVVVGLDCGLRHCCVRTIQNTIKCWGDNSKGQLGLGDRLPRGTTSSSMGDALPFVMTPAAEAVVSIRLDGDRTCARTHTGLRCWGRNGGGELGLGDQEDRGGSPQTIPRLLSPLGI
jgi:alpha-tubulin suppressor-like RCC1 family protein